MNRQPTSLGVFAIAMLIAAVSNGTGLRASDRQQERAFEREITIKVGLKYLLSLPLGYEKSDRPFPLLVFLHGSGESGDDLNRVKANGPPKLIETGKEFPFIVLSPQSSGRGWNPVVLNALLDEVISNCRVDKDRIYLTGLSMGGSGTWQFAAAYPQRFAAIAPICGAARGIDAATIKDIPIWVFHGAKDDAVPIARSKEMIEALEKAGAKQVKFTEYPDAGHDSWTVTYDNPEFYAWLLSHSRK